jgi:hypothetical protein
MGGAKRQHSKTTRISAATFLFSINMAASPAWRKGKKILFEQSDENEYAAVAAKFGSLKPRPRNEDFVMLQHNLQTKRMGHRAIACDAP